MSTSATRSLGVMRPVGGGDPIPLKKEEMVIGRRPTSDIRLDFENVSGRHCVLKLIKGVWHVRDLNSSNGTTVNGQAIAHEHGLMPDDELGIATHLFTLDYDPIAPTSIQDANQVLEEEMGETSRRRHSLMELAGLEGDRDKGARGSRPERPPAMIDRPAAADADFADVLPDEFQGEKVQATDEDFFKIIQADVDRRAKKDGS